MISRTAIIDSVVKHADRAAACHYFARTSLNSIPVFQHASTYAYIIGIYDIHTDLYGYIYI